MNAGSILDFAINVRPSAKVAAVAKLMDCHETDIRRLIHTGDLQSHRKGVRGVRIFLDSVQAYQERQTRQAPRRAPKQAIKTKTPSAAASAALRAAMAGLRAKGLA